MNFPRREGGKMNYSKKTNRVIMSFYKPPSSKSTMLNLDSMITKGKLKGLFIKDVVDIEFFYLDHFREKGKFLFSLEVRKIILSKLKKMKKDANGKPLSVGDRVHIVGKGNESRYIIELGDNTAGLSADKNATSSYGVLYKYLVKFKKQ